MKLVLVERGRPLVVGSGWRKGPQYLAFRRAMASATSFDAQVALIEQALKTPDGRISVGLDFAPSLPYARQFVSRAWMGRRQPMGSRERRLSEKATRLLIHVLCAGTRPPGRPFGPALSPQDIARVKAVMATWQAIVRPMWLAAGSDRRRLAQAVSMAGRERLAWTTAHLHELERLVVRRGVRPVTVVTQLAAWETGMSVSRVRKACAPVAIEHA